MSDEGKKVGIIGGLIAALGGAAHFADDCARVGAKGVAAEAAGVKAVGNVGDDLARAGVRGARAGEVGALGRGRLPGAPLVLPGAADDVGRVGARAAGFESEVGLAALGDEVASGTKPWKALAEELGQEVSVNVLSEVLEADSDELSTDAGKALEPLQVSLLSEREKGFPEPANAPALIATLRANPARVVVVVGRLDPGNGGALLSQPAPVSLALLHARAAAARSTLWVLGCANDGKEPCAAVAKRVLSSALEARPEDAVSLGRELVRARDRTAAAGLSVHGVARAKTGPRLVHSKI